MHQEQINVGGTDRESVEEQPESVERLILETEDAIRNTRSFLEHLRASEYEAREMVDSMTRRLEKNLQNLQKMGSEAPSERS